jgi:uncharacterized repeat protein (TIGR02543 family)
MSKGKLAGIIVACTIAIIVTVVLFSIKPWERTPSVEDYTLTTRVSPSGAGSISPSGGEYESGVEVTLIANPGSGYTFDYWSDAASGSASTLTITMDSDKSLTAHFKGATQTYTLTTSVNPSGAGSVSPSGGGYGLGVQITVTANPATGYRFVNWTGNAGTIANVNATSTIIAMNGNYSVTANFEQIPPSKFGLTISSTAGGLVTTPGEGTFIYDAGTVTNLMARPASGYQFVNWTGDVSTIANVNAASTTMTMHGSYSIAAKFEVIANKPPTINSLTADAAWTTPSGNVQVTCTASDPDGDELSYEWTTDGGDVSGTGAIVNWTAPQEVGIYQITVVVKDGHGTSATKTVPISVATEQPPTIEALLATAEHCYLKTYSWGYKVGKEREYDIECIVSNTSIELFYEWSCTGGEISGEGSIISWTAPNVTCDVALTVTVCDIAGDMVSKDLVLQVVSCSACTFGC